MPTFSQDLIARLRWNRDRGIGFFPCNEVTDKSPYDFEYFNKYKGYAETELGRKLTEFRVEYVSRFYSGPVVDVGIGSGQFVAARPETSGCDVNPYAAGWLEIENKWHDLSKTKAVAATFWDSLEHVEKPTTYLDNVEKWAFVSLPVFRSYDDILASKHFRPDEHFWYFSPSGFATFMWDAGFKVVDHNRTESDLGREGIMTFACQRRR